jgi:hypothetical protein
MSGAGPVPYAIELKVGRISSLFDALDPFPIPSRDLAKHAEDFIVGWARELPERAPIRILLHLPRVEMEHESASAVADAFRAHFSDRARVAKGDLDELFRVGRWSLAVGLGVLAVCVLISRLAHEVLGEAYFSRLLSEGIIILGWVANWRPLEIFLYDWWPLRKRRALLLRLATASIELRELV